MKEACRRTKLEWHYLDDAFLSFARSHIFDMQVQEVRLPARDQSRIGLQMRYGGVDDDGSKTAAIESCKPSVTQFSLETEEQAVHTLPKHPIRVPGSRLGVKPG